MATKRIIPVTQKIEEKVETRKIRETEEEIEEKEDLSVVSRYTQRAYSKQIAGMSVKVFDPVQNMLNGFDQNHGMMRVLFTNF